jgi:hypothetical protein
MDIYKLELWKIVKEILRLLGYDIRKLEAQIFAEEVGDDIISNINLRITERQQREHRRSGPNVQRIESLPKYLLSLRTIDNYVIITKSCTKKWYIPIDADRSHQSGLNPFNTYMITNISLELKGNMANR